MAAGQTDFQQQKDKIVELMKTQLKKGDTWYLVDSKWFKQWRKYVGYDSWDTSSVGDIGAHPGPVDNRSLYKEGSLEQLREHLTDELDYVLLPNPAWTLLCDWYGRDERQTPIARKVIEHGTFTKHCKVEVYLMDLKLSRYRDIRTVLTRYFSRSDKIGKVKVTMQELFDVPDSNHVYLWQKFKSNTNERLENMDDTIQDTGLYPGQLIGISDQQKDGTRPPSLKVNNGAQPDQMSVSSQVPTGNPDCRPKSSGKPSIQPSLECSVCFSAYSSDQRLPKVLPCGHTFCEVCVDKVKKGQKTVCPTCRKDCKSTSFPTNFSLLGILEASCQSCHGNLRKETCSHCNLDVCGTCLAKHLSDYRDEVRTCVEDAKVSLEGLKGVLECASSKTDIVKASDEDLTYIDKTFADLQSQLEMKKTEIRDEIEKSQKQAISDYDNWYTENSEAVETMSTELQSYDHQLQFDDSLNGKQLTDIKDISMKLATKVVPALSTQPVWGDEKRNEIRKAISSLSYNIK